MTTDATTDDTARCSRCGRSDRTHDAKEWGAIVRRGQIVAFVCPGCQTLDERREPISEVPVTMRTDAFGRRTIEVDVPTSEASPRAMRRR